MTALSAELQTTFAKWTRKQLPLGPGLKAYKNGSCMAKPSIKAVVPAATGSAETSDFPLGVFAETIDNSAATNTTLLVDVDFLFERTIMWRANDGSITKAANLFAPAYASDDQTVSATSTNRAKLGIIVDVDATLGVAVMLGTPSLGI